LLAVNQGFQSVSEHDDLATLHSLVLNFLDSMEELCTLCKEKGDEDDDLVKLIEGVITQYVPIYLGNQLLYWSGQYWEQSHPVISERPRSEDLVNEDLKADMDRILVYPFVESQLISGPWGQNKFVLGEIIWVSFDSANRRFRYRLAISRG